MRQDRFHRSHCPPAMWFFLLLFCVGTFFLAMDCDCDDGDPCTTNTCVGVCLTTRIDNCCQTNNDCTGTLCNQALCDTSRSRCVLQPYTDGVACDDQNVCTANDGCTGGFCVGVPLNCTAAQCQTCACDPVSGCVYQDVVDGTSCRQDTCSVSTCSAGQCTGAPMDCTHLDDHCGLGQCVDGECVHVPGTDGTLCDDGLHCTASDHCESGTCVGVQRQCFDNDPCTLNKCIEDAGNCLNIPVESHTCETTCLNDIDCNDKFPWVTDIQCRDGSCVDIADDPSMVVRFLEYDMQQCYGNRYRMAMFFAIDTAVQKYDDGNRYRIASNPEHFDGIFPKEFLGEVVNIQSTVHGNRGRTTFTLHTDCKDLADPVKGCYQFTDMYYNFVVHLHDCIHLSTWLSCLEYTSTVNTYFNLSVVDCPIQEHLVQTAITGNLEVSPDKIHITVPMHVSLTVSDGFDPWMTDIRICIPNMQTNLVQCVLGTSAQPCPNTGCFDWGSSESEALEMSWDLMDGGNMTALAAQQILSLQTCRYHEKYNRHDKCGNSGFQHGCTTDGFTVTPVFFEQYLSESYLNGGSLKAVIDVKFAGHFCGRRLQSGPSTKRELTVITVV